MTMNSRKLVPQGWAKDRLL